MKVVIKVYRETGSREDWETIVDLYAEIPDSSNLRSYSSQVEEEIKSAVAEGYPDEDADEFYVMVNEIHEPAASQNMGDITVEVLKKNNYLG